MQCMLTWTMQSWHIWASRSKEESASPGSRQIPLVLASQSSLTPIDLVAEAGAVPLLELGFDSLPYLLVSKSVSKYCARALLLC